MKKKATKPKVLKTQCYFELEGAVYIVEKQKDKIISRELLDGKTVLQSLVMSLEAALRLYE